MTTTPFPTERVREVSRMPKGRLITMVLDHARQQGHHWVLGGPHTWSKDQLVTYVLRKIDRSTGDAQPKPGVAAHGASREPTA